MAPLQLWYLRKALWLCLLLLFISSTLISSDSQNQPRSYEIFGSRRMLLGMEDEPIIIKKKGSSTTTSGNSKISTKNQTKPSSTPSKNHTKLSKATTAKPIKLPTSESVKNNKTKLIKTSSGSIKDSSAPTIKSQIKKLNSTSKSPSNSTTKVSSISAKKSSDLPQLTSSKNKTTKPITSKETKDQRKVGGGKPKSKSPDKAKAQPKKTQKQPSRIDQEEEEDEDEDDLVSEFRDLPSKFQETLVPDLERISKASQLYLTEYNKEFTKGFKPYVGSKYAPTLASIVSFAFIIIPLILVCLIFNRIKGYFSLQKLLVFIQVYLAIYFTILCLSALVTGAEPLKYFFSTSQSTYVCIQVLQTLAYVLYLLLLLMYLILVSSTETRLATKLLGLGQTLVGFAVGLHYYIKVFRRAVLRQPPKSNWKVHALYATCFIVICILGRIDRRKKAYVEEGGEEGKKS